jgi:hypothetical protein
VRKFFFIFLFFAFTLLKSLLDSGTALQNPIYKGGLGFTESQQKASKDEGIIASK